MRKTSAQFFCCLTFLMPILAGAETSLLPPQVIDASLDLGSPSLDDLSLILKLEIENPNPVSVKIEQVKADVTVKGLDPLPLKSDETLVLKPKTKTKYKVPLNLPWKSALALSAKVLDKKPIPYHAKGTAKIGGKETPFEHDGTLPTR